MPDELQGHETPIIHVGYHKAASTFLQQLVFPGLTTDHLCFDLRLLHYIEYEDAFNAEKFRRRIGTRLGQTENPLRILSHEELTGHPHGYRQSDPFRIARRLHEAYPRARILIVIRNQFDYMLSLYAYRTGVKGMETRSLDRFLAQEGDLGLLDKLRYDRLVSLYFDLFSNERVRVLPLEMLQRGPEAFLANLFAFLGCESIAIPEERPLNWSSRVAPILLLCRALNIPVSILVNSLYCLGWRDAGDRIRWGMNRFKGAKFTPFLVRRLGSCRRIVISRRRCNALSPLYAESNRRLSEKTGLDLGAYGYTI
jgi:hypothetical protein